VPESGPRREKWDNVSRMTGLFPNIAGCTQDASGDSSACPENCKEGKLETSHNRIGRVNIVQMVADTGKPLTFTTAWL